MARTDPRFAGLVDAARRLDHHCLTTRKPDALSGPPIPGESHPRDDAEEAVAVAVGVAETAGDALGPPAAGRSLNLGG